MGVIRRIGNNRQVLRLFYYLWIVFPYPLRKPLTALGILGILDLKRVTGVNRLNSPTAMKDLGNLSFWGVPEVDLKSYVLKVYGEVDHALNLTLADIEGMAAVELPVRMDCVGGFRNNSRMKGVLLADVLEAAGVSQRAESVVFHCADAYYTAHSVERLRESGAFLVYELNGLRIEKFGYPLRLAAPGTYGYKWAKWLVGLELVRGWPKGYWEERGLPRWGRVGDIW